MAARIPDIGGAPEAIAIPKANGKATKATLMEAGRSSFQWFLMAFSPSEGGISVIGWIKLTWKIRIIYWKSIFYLLNLLTTVS
jgi:hypothetical protein